MLSPRKKYILQDFLLGFQRGLSFRLHTSLSKGMKPGFLELMVTSKCNARCVMCNIWQTDSTKDLTLNEIGAILSSPLLSEVRWVTITGGEPFLRKDLIHVLKLIQSNLEQIQEILISTNGLLTNTIVNQAERALTILGPDIRLRIGVSFDGIGDSHDSVRNIKGIHDCALRTVKGLQQIQDSRLYLQGHVVVGPHNINTLDNMPSYYEGIIDKLNWFPVIISDNYFQNRDKADLLGFDPTTRGKFKTFLRKILNQEPPSPSTYYYTKLLDFLETGTRNFPCTGGYRFMQIDSRGNVHPCAYVPRDFSFGNATKQSLEEIWISEDSNVLRKKLKESNICKRCSSHCDLFSVVREDYFNFISYLLSNPRILSGILKRYLF